MSPGLAPKAVRIPISCVRRVTEYDRTPVDAYRRKRKRNGGIDGKHQSGDMLQPNRFRNDILHGSYLEYSQLIAVDLRNGGAHCGNNLGRIRGGANYKRHQKGREGELPIGRVQLRLRRRIDRILLGIRNHPHNRAGITDFLSHTGSRPLTANNCAPWLDSQSGRTESLFDYRPG